MAHEYVKISELEPTSSFGTTDQFVIVQNEETVKIDGAALVESLATLTNLATRSYVDAVVDSAPGTLDTLRELAAALNDDSNFGANITALINEKLPTSNFGLEFWNQLATVNTYHISEGSNLYWTQDRFDSALASKNTYHISEGSNLYFTNARAREALSAGEGILYNSLTGVISAPGLSSDPTFNSVTTTTLNVKNVNFTGTGAVTISSGNDLNLVAAGNVAVNGNSIGNLAFANNLAFVDLINVTGNNGPTKVAIGKNAGNSQGNFAVAIGLNTGATNQGQHAVAIGNDAAGISQSLGGTAIGAAAGHSNQGQHAVALGFNAGMLSQGEQSIAIGHNAGLVNQPANTIILSALGETQLNGIGGQTSSFYVAPIRDTNPTAKSLFYNTTTKEVTIATLNTSAVTEGTNLYYTDARVASYLTTNNYATHGYVETQIANLVNSAPTTLDTLNELATALGNDANFATTITTALGTKANTNDLATIATSGSYNDLTNVKREESFEIKTSSFNALSSSRYGINTSSSAVTATLPASPFAGDAIFFADMGGVYSTNKLTIARNGNTIMGFADDLTVSTDNESFGLCWNGTTWRIY